MIGSDDFLMENLNDLDVLKFKVTCQYISLTRKVCGTETKASKNFQCYLPSSWTGCTKPRLQDKIGPDSAR